MSLRVLPLLIALALCLAPSSQAAFFVAAPPASSSQPSTSENASTAFFESRSESRIGLLVSNDPLDKTDPMGLGPVQDFDAGIGDSVMGDGSEALYRKLGVQRSIDRNSEAFKFGQVFGRTFGVAGTVREVRFAQKGISSVFRSGEFAGKSLKEVSAGLRSGAISPDSLPIQTITRNGVTYTLNNRSLMALKQAGLKPTILKDMTGNAAAEKTLTERLKELGNVAVDFVPKARGN